MQDGNVIKFLFWWQLAGWNQVLCFFFSIILRRNGAFTWKTTRIQRIIQVSPLTMAFSIMSQILLRWWASIGCCLPKTLVIGRLGLVARRLSWCMHIAPTWCSNWFITSFVVIASSRKWKRNSVRKGISVGGLQGAELWLTKGTHILGQRILAPVSSTTSGESFSLPQSAGAKMQTLGNPHFLKKN